MARKKQPAKGQGDLEGFKFSGVILARVAEKPIKVELDGPVSVKKFLSLAKTELRHDEILSRNGEALNSESTINPGDTVIIEENDDNG